MRQSKISFGKVFKLVPVLSSRYGMADTEERLCLVTVTVATVLLRR